MPKSSVANAVYNKECSVGHRRLHVAFAMHDFGGGGAEVITVRLANELAKRGHKVEMVMLQSKGPNRKKVSPAVRVIDLEVRWLLFAPLLLWRYLRSDAPDVLVSVLFQINVFAIIARLLLPRSQTKIIGTEHAALSVHARNSRRLFTRWLFLPAAGLSYRFADKIIGVSRGVVRDLEEHLGLPSSLLGTIYNPSFSPEFLTAQGEQLQVPWLEKSDQPIIVTVGRLVPQKDHQTLLNAFQKLLQQRKARLIIMGEGQLRTALEEQARALGIDSQVTFPGYVSNPLAVMKRCDLFVLSSRWEGFPGVLIEALACGLPIVSTDCKAGPEEVLDNGAYGELVPVGDTEELYKAMERALAAPAAPARQLARASEFSIERSADAYEALLAEIVA